MPETPSSLGFLLTFGEPSVSYVVAPRQDLWTYIGHTARPSDVDVRFFHARRMTTTPALWDEFEAVLQWPTYFGRNWNAFHDLLQDLEWINAPAYAFVVFDAERLLEEARSDARHQPTDYLAAFVADLRRYAEGYREPWQLSWTETRPPKPFHVILHVEAEHEEELLTRLANAGIEVPTAPFLVPAPESPRDYTTADLEMLAALAEYVREHEGLAPWGPEGTPAPPEWNEWLANPAAAPDPRGWREWREGRG